MHMMLITHFALGKALLQSAEEILGTLSVPTSLINIDNHLPPEEVSLQIKHILTQIPYNHPILVLTDLYGSTPHNIAESLETGHTIKVLSGVNLPMLLRVFNYHYLPFEEVIFKAIEGAHNGIISQKNNKQDHVEKLKL